MTINSKTNKNKDEPRWLAVVATLATALIYAALPSNLSVGPRWLLLAVMVAVVVPTFISHRVGHHTADKMLGYLGTGILTTAMIWSLGLLVAAIPKHEIDQRFFSGLRLRSGSQTSLYLLCGTGGLTLAARMSAKGSLGTGRELSCFRRWLGELAPILTGRPILWITCSWPSIPAQRCHPQIRLHSRAGPRF